MPAEQLLRHCFLLHLMNRRTRMATAESLIKRIRTVYLIETKKCGLVTQSLTLPQENKTLNSATSFMVTAPSATDAPHFLSSPSTPFPLPQYDIYSMILSMSSLVLVAVFLVRPFSIPLQSVYKRTIFSCQSSATYVRWWQCWLPLEFPVRICLCWYLNILVAHGKDTHRVCM